MDILWIIIGIVYIVYKLMKDGELKRKTVIVAVSTVALMFVCGAIYNKTEDSDLIGVNILGIILCFIPLVIPFAVALYDENKKNVKLQEFSKQKTLEPTEICLKRDFEIKGYNIQESDLDDLLHSPISPLKHGKASITECYRWLCDQRSFEIDNLSTDKLKEALGFPYEEIPLNDAIDENRAKVERLKLTKNYILKKRGLRYRYLNRFVDDTSPYAVNFEKYVTGELKLPKEIESERELRIKELDILYQTDYDAFCDLLGYKLPKCEYPFSDKLFRKHRKMVAKWEILSKEGYVPQTDIEINMYGNWEDCKLFMDRSYELYTIKHSDLESIYGAKLTDDLLKHRGEIIELILLREGIKNDGFICRSPLTPAYEKEGAAEAAFELLKN